MSKKLFGIAAAKAIILSRFCLSASSSITLRPSHCYNFLEDSSY
ncbi:MAG: hypothetical protein ABH836_00710 [Candidatus Omnitrophota bacterium]